MKNVNYSPLVGILTSKGQKKDSFRGDLSVFKSIQKEIMKIGGLSFIFTTDGVCEDHVLGYIYYESQEKWGPISFPFPDIIYNKVSFRKDEETTSFQSLYHLYKQEHKYFFNPSFFDKWEIHQTLSTSKQLTSYLPETWIYTNMTDLLNKLHTYHSLYLKPKNGHKGQGIYNIVYDQSSYYIHKKNNRIKYDESDFVHDVEKLINQRHYLLQKDIQTDLIDNCKYDLRILCLYNHNGFHKICGIGIRKAVKNSIITHVPNGGEIVSFEKMKHICPVEELNWLSETVGALLTKQYGFIGEFSLDVGLTPEGKPIIFEVNSKPMIFDERDIQKRRITHLVQLFSVLNNTN
ncbi:YheC/YheD family endospore coat-associated protein [Metabacillus rhizolycopersici]|uniref:YheC/YheD family protein n=1 Tax=Metabacillus rhizolycopersici TaxID=2875709 RepID=A0ABS7ULU4_9BACI|nr:YheC/YheD family protein [Metabacillus rhizolycopersici]MBZ5748923.1 YheC/YheD family protein [Metabacillus rhizolycopersici]